MSILERLTCETADLGEENVKKLLTLFPECACEQGQVDFDQLRQVLSSHVLEGDVERYQFTWPGKRAAMAEANRKTNKTFRPVREDETTPTGIDSEGHPYCSSGSVNFNTTENLYIEGDNLEALKLLQSAYAGKVKMIYIDPPYNTGKDFVYRDYFSLDDEEIKAKKGIFDEEGKMFTKYERNDEAEARYHTNWCNMMYPRLKLARELLSEDGVIFISIDDAEVENMRRLCNELFGNINFRNSILVRRRIKSLNSQFAENGLQTLNVGFEYVLVYAKSKNFLMKALRQKKDVAQETGKWQGFWSNADRPTMRYEILGFTPTEGQWRKSKEKAEVAVANYQKFREEYSEAMTLEEYSKQTGITSFIRRDLNGRGQNGGVYHWVPPSDSTLRTSIWTDLEVSQIIKEIDLPFDNPKNRSLISELIQLAEFTSLDVILDFFSGSATTAHAVMQLNAEDGGKRKFILVQLPEVTDEKSEAYKAGYQNICEIGKERIRRAGKKIQEEHPLTTQQLDVGFRVLKIDSSSINDVSQPVNAMSQEEMNFESERIKADRSSEDLLFQVLLQTQIPLSEKIERETICGNEVFTVGGVMVACLDKQAKLTEAFFTALAERQPAMAFFRDDTFVDDSARTNLEQIFKQFSKDTKIKVL